MFKHNYCGENEVIKPPLKKIGLGHIEYTFFLFTRIKESTILVLSVNVYVFRKALNSHRNACMFTLSMCVCKFHVCLQNRRLYMTCISVYKV